MPNNRPGILAISNQGLLFAVSAPIVDVEKQNVDFDTDACPIYIRRTDFLLNKIAVIESTGEVLVTGKDRMLKKYRFPDENILRTDPKSKPPSNPLEELPGHDLPVTVVAHSSNGKFIAMGSQDGTITFRDTAHLAEAKSVRIFTKFPNLFSSRLITTRKVVSPPFASANMVTSFTQEAMMAQSNYGLFTTKIHLRLLIKKLLKTRLFKAFLKKKTSLMMILSTMLLLFKMKNTKLNLTKEKKLEKILCKHSQTLNPSCKNFLCKTTMLMIWRSLKETILSLTLKEEIKS